MSAQRASQLVEAGLWLRLSGDHDGARRLFEQALRLDPTNARARQLLDSRPAEPAAPPSPPKQPEPPPQQQPSSPTMLQFSAPSPPPIAPVAPSPPPKPVSSNPFLRQPSSVSPMETDWGMATGLETADAVLPPLITDATSAWDHKSNPGMHISKIAPGMGSAMDMVALDDRPASGPPPVSPRADDAIREEVHTLLRGAKDLLDLDDHTGAMDLIAKALELSPTDPEVQKMRDKSERTLQAMFESKLGKLDAIPRVALKDDEIIWLNLDHRAGFVLAQIDGTVTFEDLFAVSGMSRLDTARILAQLVEEGVIGRGV
jgi:tetratricopeptide (TPR) repeat protein